MVEWWRVRPRQAAPPRTTSISSSRNPAGRFIANEEMLRNEVWAGAKTLPGQALQLPKVTPYVSYAIALVTAAVYGTAVRVYDTQGADAAAELLGGLGLSRAAVVEQSEVWRLLSGCLVQADLASLFVVLYGMLVVAPRVEASLGYRTFTAAYGLSAIVAADALIAFASAGAAGGSTAANVTGTAAAAAAPAGAAPAAALLDALTHPGAHALAMSGDPGLLCGGLGAVMGISGCSLAHQVINGDVEREASDAGSNSSSSSASGSSGRSSGEGTAVSAVAGAAGVADARTVVLLAGAAAVALQHALEPGGMALAAALGAGLGTGFLISSIAGPRYQVTREVELPDGSMWIPDPEAVNEVTVVLDRTPSIQRSLATTAVAAAVLVATLTVAFTTAG